MQPTVKLVKLKREMRPLGGRGLSAWGMELRHCMCE